MNDPKSAKRKSNYHNPGMRRVRLLLWKLFNQTPLTQEINEVLERQVAAQCKLSWEEYCALKQKFAELWQRSAAKREVAIEKGGFPRQPPQLRRWRRIHAKEKAVLRKERSRFTQWAGRKLMKQRGYSRQWLRKKVLARLAARLVGL